LGDLPAPTTPSGKLTPAIRAQEQLRWRLGLAPAAPEVPADNVTLFEAIDKAAELGLLYIGGSNLQTVSREIPKSFDGRLSDDEMRQVRLKLDAAGVRLLTYRVGAMPSDEASPPAVGRANWRSIFEFGRKMGVEAFIAEPPRETLDTIEKLCDEYDIKLAVGSGDEKTPPHFGHPQEILKVCHGRSKRMGAYGSIASWMRFGIDPLDAIRELGDRLTILQVHSLNEPHGAGAGEIGRLLEEIHRLSIRPTMFGFEYPQAGPRSMPAIVRTIESFNNVIIQLAKQGAR
jgi:sugar phosphate isomerase/epimerase